MLKVLRERLKTNRYANPCSGLTHASSQPCKSTRGERDCQLTLHSTHRAGELTWYAHTLVIVQTRHVALSNSEQSSSWKDDLSEQTEDRDQEDPDQLDGRHVESMK